MSSLIRILFFFALTGTLGHGSLVDYLKPAESKIDVQSIRNIDYIYVINLDHRAEKFQQTLDEFRPYNIVPYRFSGINGWKLPIEAIWDLSLKFEEGMRPGAMGTVYRIFNGKEYHSSEVIETIGTPYLVHCTSRGGIGCILSHLSVIQDALNSDYEVIWICEDDIEIIRNPAVLSDYIDDLDRIIGRPQWDILFTFRDYKGNDGKYYTPYGANHRPNIDTRDQQRFNIDLPISSELRQVGSRFGTQSMILTKNGMKKILNFYKKHKIFMPYDLDLSLIPDIKIYSVLEDVVTNRLNSISDLGSSPTN